MTYDEYLRGISFRVMRPWMPRRAFTPLIEALKKRDIWFEVHNTRLPMKRRSHDQKLRELSSIPRMSTYAIAAMINRGVEEMPDDQAFVNVGVWHGYTFLSAMAGNESKRCVGVDNFSEFGGPRDEFLARFEANRSERHEFYDMDYEDYFAEVHQGPIGFYLYDGEHSYDNQLKGMQVAEPHLADGAIVLIDDTNLPQPRDAIRDFLARSEHKYTTLLDARCRSNLHPTLWNGVTILRKVG